MDAKDKKYRSYNFTDLKKAMKHFGYTPGYFIELMTSRNHIDQNTMWFCLIILMNKYRIKQSKRLNTPDSAYNYDMKLITRTWNNEGDNLFAIRMDLKRLTELYKKIPRTLKSDSNKANIRLRMKELFIKIMRSKRGTIIRKELAKITKDSRELVKYSKKYKAKKVKKKK